MSIQHLTPSQVLARLPQPENEPKPKSFFETAHKARAFGEAAFGLSMVATFASLGALYFIGGMPIGWGKMVLIVVGLAGTCSFLPGAILAADYKNREYWNDPAYRNERRQKIIETFILIGEEGAHSLHQATWQRHKLFTSVDIQQIIQLTRKNREV